MQSVSIHNAAENTLLLSDALERVLCNPGAAHVWRHLAQRFSIADPAQKKMVLALLQQHAPGDGVAGFLRATWCASLTGELHFCQQAGRIVQSILPFDPHRIAAYLVYVWAKRLPQVQGVAAFIETMHGASFPQLVRQLGQHLQADCSARPPLRTIDTVRRVALIAPQMGPHSHAPTGLALDHAALLKANGIDCELFCGQEFNVPGLPDYLGNGENVILGEANIGQWSHRVHGDLGVHMVDGRLSLMHRWRSLLGAIAAFDPDLVLLVGLYSPLMHALYASRPVLGLSVHATASIAPTDVWLCADPALAGSTANPWSPQMPDSLAWHHPFRVRIKAPSAPVTRAALGLADDACVLVSVGYRLDQEITGDWARRMVATLQAQPSARWLLVGGGPVPAALAGLAPSQMLMLPHQDGLAALYACCDVYVNPPRMGGGFSVAEAMAAGLPVLAYAGSDGGSKIGAAAHADEAAYFAHLTALLQNPALRREQGTALRKLFADTLDLDQSGPSLLAACDAALQRFRQRSGGQVTV
jgi:glycosyltransferase involved in cell wall biosynthesis